jgi:hypothetical protein
MMLKSILTPIPLVALDKSYCITCLPISSTIANVSKKKLDQSIRKFPKSWPFMDKVLLLFFPELINDVRKFYSNKGPNMETLFQECQLKIIDKTLNKILKEYLISSNTNISLEYKQILRNEELKARWEAMFKALKKLKKEHGKDYIPEVSKSDGELYTWVMSQRHRFKGKMLNNERIKRLEEIGFEWQPSVRKMASSKKVDLSNVIKKAEKEEGWWRVSFFALIEYKNKYGNCNVPEDLIINSINLGGWVCIQRWKYEHKVLNDNLIELLEDIGFKWK